MLDNIESVDVVSLLIWLVLAVQGAAFTEFLVYERSRMT